MRRQAANTTAHVRGPNLVKKNGQKPINAKIPPTVRPKIRNCFIVISFSILLSNVAVSGNSGQVGTFLLRAHSLLLAAFYSLPFVIRT